MSATTSTSGSPSSNGQSQTKKNDRNNTEIWSTRVQRELLALTTGNESESSKEESVGLLPPFITLKEHNLNITDGTCIISFLIDIPNVNNVTTTTIENDATGDATSEQAAAAVRKITVMLNVSLEKQADGKIDPNATAYPFQEPNAVLFSGADYFPKGSTVKDGDFLAIDCDWTPSLHLSDAILNVGLKVKESILQGEPFHPNPNYQPNQDNNNDEKDPIEDLMQGAKRLSSKFSAGLRGLGTMTVEKGRNLSLHPIGEREQKENEGANPNPQTRRLKKREKNKPQRKSSPPGEISIGDEINLLESPWVDAQGVYSCKAVRRPGFVEDAIKNANIDSNDAATAGFQGAGAMFRSITQSARSVLEESFIMITDTHIIEMKSSKLNLSVGTVVFAIPIGLMAKLKFRRQESISLFFKPTPDDPLIYMCPDSSDAVHQIQSVLKRHGVRGKHTNAAAHRAINEALQLVQEIQTKELALRHDPSVERVNEIMDLYRQAAERFESAGDVRHEEVVTHMRKFLALPVTVSILDGSYKIPVNSNVAKTVMSPSKTVPEGEVLERTLAQLVDDDMEDGKSKEEEQSDKLFEESMANILKEAQEDLESFKLDDDAVMDTEGSIGASSAGKTEGTASTTNSTGDAADDVEEAADAGDAFADLDAMLHEAGKELDELMSS